MMMFNSYSFIFVFFLSGVWHGANMTFIVWGILHGAFHVAERVIEWREEKLIQNSLYPGSGSNLLFPGKQLQKFGEAWSQRYCAERHLFCDGGVGARTGVDICVF